MKRESIDTLNHTESRAKKVRKLLERSRASVSEVEGKIIKAEAELHQLNEDATALSAVMRELITEDEVLNVAMEVLKSTIRDIAEQERAAK